MEMYASHLPRHGAFRLLELATLIAAVVLACPAASHAGLVALYKFEGDFKDSSGNGNHGAAVGNATICCDVANATAGTRSLSLKGGHVRVGDSDSLDIGPAGITITAWVKQATASFAAIVTKGPHGDHSPNHAGNYELRLDPDRVPQLLYEINPNSDSTRNAKFDPPVSAVAWSHIAVTMVGRTYTYYLNGAMVRRDPADDAFAGLPNMKDLLIGTRADGFTVFNPGQLDEISIWDEALAADEIGKIFTHGIPVSPNFRCRRATERVETE